MILIPQYRTARRAAAGAAASISWLQSAADTVNRTAYTFSAQNLGAASSDRYIICAATSRGTPTAFSAVTIGGVGATQVAVVGGGGSGSLLGLFIASVPTGTTGDVVVELDAGALRCHIALWAATGINGTATDFNAQLNVSSIDVAQTAGGIVVAAFNIVSTSPMTWTNVTERYDDTVESAIQCSGGDAISASPGTLTVSNSTSPGTSSIVIGAWGPA